MIKIIRYTGVKRALALSESHFFGLGMELLK